MNFVHGNNATTLPPRALVLPENYREFRLPWFATQTAWLGHIPFAQWLVLAKRPSTVVELGVFSGASFLAFCHAAQQAGTDARCYGVDTWTGDGHTGPYPETVYRRLSHFVRRRHPQAVLIRASFDDALARFADGSIDLLHIDGFHRYEAVRHDFEAWQPKLSSRGVVLFHDIAVTEKDFGVHRLWDELKNQFPHFAFQHHFGLGVIGVGADVPVSLRALFEATHDKDAGLRLRSHFEMRGSEVLEAEPPFLSRLAVRFGWNDPAIQHWRRYRSKAKSRVRKRVR